MTMYQYENVVNEPDLGTWNVGETLISGIAYDVLGSAMTDKSIDGCSWHEHSGVLCVCMENSLSGGDETILDGIVSSNT